MSRLKISHTLIALFLVVAVIVSALAVSSLGGIKMMNERNNEIATTWLPRVSLSRALETQLSDTRMAFARHLISLTPFEKKAAEKVIGETVAGFNKLADEYSSLMVTDADKAGLDNVRTAYQAYLSVAEGMVKLSNNLENMKAQSVFKVEMRETEGKVDEAIKEMRALNLAGADAAVAASSATHDQIRMIEIGVIALAAVIVLGAILYAVRGIARPIQIDLFDRIEGDGRFSGVVHRKNDTGQDLDDQHDREHGTEGVGVVQVPGNRIADEAIVDQTRQRQTGINPFLNASRRRVG